MMKKLLLCSETSTEDLANDNGNVEDDGQDVVVESPCLKDSLKTLCDVDNLNIKNFNYDVCKLNDKTNTLVLFGRSKAAATPEEVNTRSAEASRAEKYIPQGSYHGSWITKCKQCNKAISVSTGDKAAVCPQCKTPFFNHI